jgi:uncharacterized protein YxjI
MDGLGNELYVAAEEPGSLLLRWFLKALRPFSIVVANLQGNHLLRLARPFRFYFHQLDVYEASGKHLGTIQKRFSLIRRIYSVLDSTGQETCQLFGPILRPWTFKIRKREMEIGRISKKWSGLLKEGFTDADQFGVSFPLELEMAEKSLLLGAVFLIDFVHFEDRN